MITLELTPRGADILRTLLESHEATGTRFLKAGIADPGIEPDLILMRKMIQDLTPRPRYEPDPTP